MKFAFFGTPKRAARTLSVLEEHDLIPSLIVTAPDRKKGRGLKLAESEVKTWAKDHNIPILQPETLNDIKDELEREEWDLFVVVAYGKIMPQWVLDMPKHKSLNVHYSLLPKYRGATPVETQILNGEEEVGVTVMLMDEKLDHGPILSMTKRPMPDPLPTNPELVEILTDDGANLLADTVPRWIEGNITPQEQDHNEATFTHKFSKEEACIFLENNPHLNFRKIQAFQPWPKPHFFVEKNGEKIRVIIKKASYEKGGLTIERVIPEGKKEMSWNDFQNFLNS